MRRQQLVIDDTGSVEDIHGFIYCKKIWTGVTDALQIDSLADNFERKGTAAPYKVQEWSSRNAKTSFYCMTKFSQHAER